MEWIKTNWKLILIVVLALLFITKCTSSCTNKNVVKKQTTEIVQLHNTIDSLNIVIGNYEKDVFWLKSNKDDISNVATSSKASYIEVIDKLNKDNNSLRKSIDNWKYRFDTLNVAYNDLLNDRD